MIVSVALVLAVGGCRRSSESERRATTEAEQEASETTLTSAVMDAGPRSEDESLRAQAESIAALRQQQIEYRGKLQGALDKLEAKRKDAKKRGPAELKVIDARREVLKKDLDALDAVNDDDWASLKTKIDRDLREHG